MGAVGTAAPTIFNQWVQTMYSAPNIFWTKNTLFLTESQKTRSSFRNKLSQYSGQPHSKAATNTQNASDRYWFYHSFILSLDSWKPFTRAPSSASGIRLCTLHLQCSRRSYQTCPWIPKSDLWAQKISRLTAVLDPWSNRIPWWSSTVDLRSYWIPW